ncbi:MAG: pyridoxamine 5'-phosphate oxidase family protein [Haloferacaceae archaeon]
MTISEQTEMGASAIDAFLGAQETGVLALRADDSPEPYAIPISYGYDAEQRCFYVRLVSTPDSEKRAFLASSPRARLVVYSEEDPVYRSVIATGTLEELDPADLTPDQIEQFGGAKRPLFEIWTENERELDIGLYQLRPTELNGRRVEVERSDSSA